MKNVNTLIVGFSKGMTRGDEKNGVAPRPFYVAHLGIPFGVEGLTAFATGEGYMAKSVYLDSADEYEEATTYKVGETYPLTILNLGQGRYKWVID